MGGSSSKQSPASKTVQPATVINSPNQSRPSPSAQTPLNISIDAVANHSRSHEVLNKNFSTDMLITPGREECMYSKVAYTPQGEQARTYKYYCPLCMSFCMDIFKSKCCNNYTCGECCTDFLNKRDQQICTMNDLLVNAPYKDTACPHCNTMHFHPILVSKTDKIRDYSYNSLPVNQSEGGNALAAHSPLKIGDSFEVMKNKMEKLNSSPNAIAEGVESPVKALFPSSARDDGTPRGIAVNQTSSSSGHLRQTGPENENCTHRSIASTFVEDIFSSHDQLPAPLSNAPPSNYRDNSHGNISDVATAFVQGIFSAQSSREGSRRGSKNKVTPLDLNADSFDGVSIDGANSHRESSSRRVLAQ